MAGMNLYYLVVLAVLGYLVVRTVYRVFFSPLAKFPGPILAATTLLYEAWYDVARRGQYTFKIAEMHRKYGSIVRISPYELHVNHPKFYASLYAENCKREKYSWSTRIYGNPKATIATIDHDLHSLRRSAMAPSLSVDNIQLLDTVIQQLASKMMLRLHELGESGQPITLSQVYHAFTSDVLTAVAYGKCFNYLDRFDFNKPIFEVLRTVHELGHIAKQFGWVLALILRIPHWMAVRADPNMIAFVEFERECRKLIKEVLHNIDEKAIQPLSLLKGISRSDLPACEKTEDRLWQEAQILLGAGTEPSAWTLSVITFHLLSQPEKLQRLKEELGRVTPKFSSIPPYNELKKLPYLSSVIREGLRLASPVCTRLQRISPHEMLHFVDGDTKWSIPPGIPVSMSAALLHMDPIIFPSPEKFVPERWLDNPGLERYLVSFSKGSRQCSGINLAFAEMYICIACVFRDFDGSNGTGNRKRLELFKTTEEDVTMCYDMAIPFSVSHSEGIRVLICD